MQDNNNLLNHDRRPSVEERRKDMKVFTFARQVRKKENNSFLNWIAKMFFSGRKPKDIAKYVIENEIVPSLQDGLYNSITSFAGKAIYKEDRKTPTTTSTYSPSGSFITNYVKFSDKKKEQKSELELTKQKEQEAIQTGFTSPAFENIRQAEDFLNSMHEYVSKYDTMSVQDLAWMQNKSIDSAWDKWGWWDYEIKAITNPVRFQTPMIVENPDGTKAKLTHYIELPKAHEFN